MAKLKGDLAADPGDPMKKYRAVFAEGRGVAWDKRLTFNAAQGIELTTAAQWIAEPRAWPRRVTVATPCGEGSPGGCDRQYERVVIAEPAERH